MTKLIFSIYNNFLPFIKQIELHQNEEFVLDRYFHFGSYFEIFANEEEKLFAKELTTQT